MNGSRNNLFNKLTAEEKDRMNNYNFDELWSDLFVNKSCRLYILWKRVFQPITVRIRHQKYALLIYLRNLKHMVQ